MKEQKGQTVGLGYFPNDYVKWIKSYSSPITLKETLK